MVDKLSPAAPTFIPNVSNYKHTRNRALEVMRETADSCSQHSTIYSGLSQTRLQNMRDASRTQEGQLSFEGKVLMILTGLLGSAGIVGAVINPVGSNAQVLQTAKGVAETVSKALQPASTAVSTTCKAHQEPSQTQKTVAQSGTQEAHTIEGEMDQKIRTMQSTAQQLVQTSEIKV